MSGDKMSQALKIVFLYGSPGMGKSFVLNEVAQVGWKVLQSHQIFVHATVLDSKLPFAVFGRIAAQAVQLAFGVSSLQHITSESKALKHMVRKEEHRFALCVLVPALLPRGIQRRSQSEVCIASRFAV